jgi:hypothetical protein
VVPQVRELALVRYQQLALLLLVQTQHMLLARQPFGTSLVFMAAASLYGYRQLLMQQASMTLFMELLQLQLRASQPDPPVVSFALTAERTLMLLI